MRGGALPLLAWAALLAVLAATCAIWTGEGIEIAVLVFAVTATLCVVAALVLADGRQAVRRGEPERDGDRPQAAPDISPGTAVVAVGLGALVFGLTFGHFFIYFGAGLMVLGGARLAMEIRSQRESLERYRTGVPAGREDAGGGHGR